jgi:endonuclease III
VTHARRGASKRSGARRRSSAKPPDQSTIREIHRRLGRAFGPLDPGRRLDPVEELVLTILSQNTSDVNSGRAYEALRTHCRTWESRAGARERRVADAIRPGGLANVKAPRILAVLREIRKREGRIDLSWLDEASDEEVETYLTSLPGVGPKTAACVLAFSLGRPALPVDTHVHRVATRLGLLPPGTTAAHAHRILRDLVPARLRVAMHVGMIRLGREICRAGRPSCEVCPLNDLCPTAPVYLGRRPKSSSSKR